LFNWLYARRHGGKMLLRIEDTDRERSTAAAINAIIDGLTWLGLTWDGEIVFQFSRAARHRQVAEQLLTSSHGYRCYCSQDELTAMREKARAEGRTRLYDGRCRDRDPKDVPAGVNSVIRIKAPLTGETVVEDQVQGRVVWQNENLDDFVLLRSDAFNLHARVVSTITTWGLPTSSVARSPQQQTQIYQARVAVR
jgi:glutamyl-tRNA synthetase